MTNPGNAIGTNGAYSGRTSVNAFNDDLSVYSRGVLSGWSCSVSSGLTVALGGVNGTRDVAVATDNNGNNTTINNISESPVNVTISSAPATDSRIDAIVAYVDNPPQGVSTTADNPNACGLIVVKGTAASSPIEPSESTIRSAITVDGASGTTAYYVVLAEVTIASGTTDLDASNINQGEPAQMGGGLIENGSISGEQLDWNTLGTGYAEAGGRTSYFRRTKWVTIWDYSKRGSAPATATVTDSYTSPSGNTYGFIIVNHRTGGAITSGAEEINHARGGFAYQPTNNRNVQISVRGVATNQSTYFDCLGGFDIATSTAITPYRYTSASTGQPYSGAITIGSSSSNNTVTIEWDAVRATTTRWWHITGTIAGQRVVETFEMNVNATDGGTIPGIYMTGTSSNLPVMVGSWFEICEPQDD